MKSFILHDESKNTQGYRMLTSGADLTEFRKNPVMLLNHNDWSMPIGRWENIRIDGSKILADAIFDENDTQAKLVSDKVERDFIRAASVGAWRPQEDDIVVEFDTLGKSTVTVKKWVIREASIVTIPSNHNALTFYDRESGGVVGNEDLLKLFDHTRTDTNKKSESHMSEISKILKLADNASESEVTAAVQVMLSDNDRLKTENSTLTTRIDELNQAAKARLSSEAVALVDAAIKDGRIDAKARESYLKLFDLDHENAMTTLVNIPKRESVTGKIEGNKTEGNTELADILKKSWDELDKAGQLLTLRDKYPDLYKEKFKTRFGVEPK